MKEEDRKTEQPVIKCNFISRVFPSQILLYLFLNALLLHVSSRLEKWACEVVGKLVTMATMVFMKELINFLHQIIQALRSSCI